MSLSPGHGPQLNSSGGSGRVEQSRENPRLSLSERKTSELKKVASLGFLPVDRNYGSFSFQLPRIFL